MAIKNVAMQAYSNALQTQRQFDNKFQKVMKPEGKIENSFNETLTGSLKAVNDLQANKKKMIQEFASGKNDSVHELMIAMQKSSVAMSMTSAVRTKIVTAYQEMLKMPF